MPPPTRISLIDQVEYTRQDVLDASALVSIRASVVAYKTLSTSRILTLPSAKNYPKDTPLLIVDESGNCSSSMTITVASVSQETVFGLATIKLSRPYQRITVTSDGNANWSIEGNADEVITNLIKNGPLADAFAKINSTSGSLTVNQGNFAQFSYSKQLTADDGKIIARGLGPGLNIIGIATEDGDTNRYITLYGNTYGDTVSAKTLSCSGSFTTLNATVTGVLNALSSNFVALAAISPPGGDITKRIEGGCYGYIACKGSLGWPEDGNPYMHLLASTHVDKTNYYSLQIAGGFMDNTNFYVRKTNNNGAQPWNTLYHSGNQPVVSKNINYRSKSFNIRDYGADENASADTNVAAFNSAYADMLNTGGGTIILAHGDLPVNAILGNTDDQRVPVRIVGATTQSRLVFNNAPIKQGLFLTGAGVKVEGFKVKAVNCPNIGAGALLTVKNTAQLGASFGMTFVCDIGLEGAADAIPSAFLNVVNPAHGRVNGVSIVGFLNTSYGKPNTSRGIYFNGTVAPDRSAVGDHSVLGCTIFGVGTGFEVDSGVNGIPTVEGTSFTDCVVVGASTGLYMHGNGYAPPGHSWKGGHLNCSTYCVRLDSISQFTIADVLMYMDKGQTGQQGFVSLNNSPYNIIRDNKMYYQALTGAPDQNVAIYGVGLFGTSTKNRITGNDAYGLIASSPLAIQTTSGAQGNRASLNGKSGSGTILAGNITDLGGNHTF